ncbi:hypothetical protein ACSQ67_015819 [Phaseolus vulgaris]
MGLEIVPIDSTFEDYQTLYEEWFNYADADGDGRFTGKEAIKLFTMSNLSRQELKQVWAIADTKREGYLGFKEFVTAMQKKKRKHKDKESSVSLTYSHAVSPQPSPASNWFSAKSTKEVSASSVTSIIDGLKKLYLQKLKPLEVAYNYNDFVSPLLLCTSCYLFVLLTIFIRCSYWTEPTTDRFVVVMVG